jgi:hypothetical protein
MKDAQIGADVHAIGHPTGESWSYTKGIISQIRSNYEWSGGDAIKHKADVIQTQTPINPGNSGGPLLSSRGSVIGLNSFKSSGEGINFAISVKDLKAFLARTEDRYATRAQPAVQNASNKEACEIKVLGDRRNEDNTAWLIYYDINCDGKADAFTEVPDDEKKGVSLFMLSADGKINGQLYSSKRDEKWDWSLWDTQNSGKPDLFCYHDDGGIKPSRCQPYEGKLEKVE